MENLEMDRQAIFEEIVEMGRAEGVVDEEAYNSLVEGVVEDHRAVGEIHDDSSYENLIETLKARFKEYSELVGNV